MAHVKVLFPAFRTVDVVRRLKDRLVLLQSHLPVTRIVLFGSYATGRHTATSDIDLLVVYGGAERRDAYKVVVDDIRLPGLEPHVYSEREFELVIRKSPKYAEVLATEGIWITGKERDSWSSGAKTG